MDNGFLQIEFFLLIAGAYLLGSVPFGLLLGRLAGVDIRQAGSGNIGATNVGRLLGKKMAALTLLADLLKGVLPMLLAVWWLAGQQGAREVVLLCGGGAFIGHLLPLYLGFKGGKGVATALGIFLYLTPAAALGTLAVFALVLLNWGYVSLASLSAALLMPGLIWVFYGRGWETTLPAGEADGLSGLPALLGAHPAWPEALLALFCAGLIWYRHRDNIRRLWRGEEKRFK